MKLYIVRHGLTQWNLDKIIQGCIDTELLPQGRDDAQVLSEKIGDYPVEIVYTSPLRRAYDTAQILNQSIKKPLVVKEKLREIEFGDWEGLTWREVKEKYPDLLADNEIGYANPPNGETFLQAKERVGSAVEEIIEKQQDCLVVTHRATIRFIFYYLLDKTPKDLPDLSFSNLSLLELDLEEGQLKNYRRIPFQK